MPVNTGVNSSFLPSSFLVENFRVFFMNIKIEQKREQKENKKGLFIQLLNINEQGRNEYINRVQK